MLCSYENGEPKLFTIDPSGVYYVSAEQSFSRFPGEAVIDFKKLKGI